MDKPVTDAELDRFYGVEPTQGAINHSITRFTESLDESDLADIAYEHTLLIKAAVKEGDALKLLALFSGALKEIVARRASVDIFGRPGVITSKEVML